MPSHPRMQAWVFYDWAHNAFGTVVQTFVFAPFFVRAVAPSETVGTTYWGNAIGVAGLCVAVLGPVLGAIADQGGRRKPWIGGFTGLCIAGIAALALIAPDSAFLWPAVVIVVLGNVGAEFALVFYNAMLPDLVPRDRLGRWSGWGWAMGYIGGIACLAAVYFLFVGHRELTLFSLDRGAGMHIRWAMVFTAGWFAVFALPMFLFTPDRRGPGKPLRQAARDGVEQLLDSVKHLNRYAGILRFLVARMLYVNGLATMFSMGGVFAAALFGMSEQEVLLFGITLNVTAGIGACSVAWINDRLGDRLVIVCGLIGLIIPGACMLLAQSVVAFWLWGLVLGIFVGPVQSASRSYLARAAPEDLRTQFFGLYALSGKATAFAGPFLVGWITMLTGSSRAGMSSILVLFVAGLAVICTVPAPKVAAAES